MKAQVEELNNCVLNWKEKQYCLATAFCFCFCRCLKKHCIVLNRLRLAEPLVNLDQFCSSNQHKY